MVCNKCKHTLTKEEIKASQCRECGTKVKKSWLSNNYEASRDVIAKAQKEQVKASMIAKIVCFIAFFIIGDMEFESLIIFIGIYAAMSIVDYFFEMLITIAYLMCDIKDNASEKNIEG